MRRRVTLALFLLAAGSWIAAGPGGATVRALIACRHHSAHQAHPGRAGGGHNPASPDGPCFCGEMTGGWDVAVSPALAAPSPLQPVLPGTVLERSHPSSFLLPPSPSFAPISPPPDRVA